MQLIKNILLAHDFSKPSENLEAAAVELAKIFESEIIPIHVLPDDIGNEKVKSLLQETATQKLKEIAQRLEKEGIKTPKQVLTFGSPNEKIVETAVDENANLILVGSGETQKDEKFLLGTTTERIIQKSEKPVLVIKEGTPLKVKQILCPVDFSLTSKRALKNAITMAHRLKAKLTILSVCDAQGSDWITKETERINYTDKRYEENKIKLDKFLEAFNFTNLDWEKEIRRGKPAKEILNLISEKMVDLLVIGTSGKTGLSRLVIGSVTEKVIREMPCSFLTLKSEDIITLQLETTIQDIEKHYKIAVQLADDGFFEESIEQFKLCLSLNNMHVPSHYGIAKVYEKLNMPEKAKVYRDGGKYIMDRIWDQKIEEEIRKFRGR
jgi:nucleotide-binding universal stress UspA family protein